MNEEEVRQQLEFNRFLLNRFTKTLKAVNDRKLSQSAIDDTINCFVRILENSKVYEYPWTSAPVLFLIQCYLDRFDIFEF